MAVYNVRPSFWAGEIEVYVARRPTMPCPINDSSRPIDKTSLNDNFIKKKALDIGREKKGKNKSSCGAVTLEVHISSPVVAEIPGMLL
jgi:hypothetical protein